MQTREKALEKIKADIENKFPFTLKILRKYERELRAKTEETAVKDYYISKQKNKKLGYIYIVRYHGADGKIVPSHWSTKTNCKEEAEQFAIKNRERLLKAYYEKHEADKLYKQLADYYGKNSEDYHIDIQRGDRKTLCERNKKQYFSFINNVFIPYMKNERNKRSLGEIENPDIIALQNKLLKEGIKGQSINKKLSGVKMVFNYFIKAGKIEKNPIIGNSALKGKVTATGMYELNELKDVFKREWEDKTSYLLNLISYTCGLRNEEIRELRVNDITNCLNKETFNNQFLKVCSTIEGKTENAPRNIPLHRVTCEKIKEYIKNHKGENDYIFDKIRQKDFKEARNRLGALVGYKEEDLDNKNIKFYSGRHFFKTMLNAQGLGTDIEEYFMGHKVSPDIKKRYNHKDKIGRENLEEKIKTMFDIIDGTFF